MFAPVISASFGSGVLRLQAKAIKHNHVRAFGRSRQSVGRVNTTAGGKSVVSDRVNQLDLVQDNSEFSTVQTRSLAGRLRKGLGKERKTYLDAASQGSSEVVAEDIREILNEALESPKFKGIFRGFQTPSKVVDIVDVTTNRDLSHVTAYWHSLPMAVFLRVVHKKLGEEEAVRYTQKVVDSIDATFSAKEGAFRSYLMQKMDFKRVPRIMFRPAGPENMKGQAGSVLGAVDEGRV